jgi:hypothetical protein
MSMPAAGVEAPAPVPRSGAQQLLPPVSPVIAGPFDILACLAFIREC